MNPPQKCHPHCCAFDSPACPELCKSTCNRIKPNCVSVTAQEAMNLPELKVPRSRTGIPMMGICTRERVFGIPYDPRKDFDVPVPQEDMERYLQENYDSLHNKAVKDYLKETCCQSECKCSMGPCCMCRNETKACEHENRIKKS